MSRRYCLNFLNLVPSSLVDIGGIDPVSPKTKATSGKRLVDKLLFQSSACLFKAKVFYKVVPLFHVLAEEQDNQAALL